MALSLSAEQKNLKNIFMNDNRYIVGGFNVQMHYAAKL